MTDTPRSLADILALFSDQTSEDISPQDLRDAVVSITSPVADGGFDVHDGQLLVTGHSAFGNEGVIDPENVEGLLTYAHAPTALYVYEASEAASPDAQMAVFAMYSILEYERSTPFGTGEGQPALVGGSAIVKYEATAGATGEDYNDGVFGMYNGVFHAGEISPGWVQGELAAITVADGAATVAGGLFGLQGFVTLFGASPANPGPVWVNSAGMYNERTGTFEVYMDRLSAPGGAGVMTTLYGLYVEPMTKGSVVSYNIFSAGTTSKNKFQGRVFEGTPNSAPPDADLDNGQISAYLDQSGNKIKWRARYSDGTLKTGEVALT